MKILWLPHHNWEFIRRGQREYRLAETIRDVHEIHFMSWLEVRTKPSLALEAMRRKTWREDGLIVHQAPRVPNPLGQRVHEKSARGLRINEILHQRAVRRLVRRERIDVVICGISHQSVGLPPADLDVPLVFDYLDFKLEAWPEVEAEYLRLSDAVLCTSEVLVERTKNAHPHTYYVPNGVDVGAAATANGARIRDEYGLNGAKVVSLIGITASTNLFYVDGMAAAAREVGDLVFLLVGDGGALGESMVRRAHELGLRVVATGPVSPAEVADYFAASDVGLYPGDKNAYFDAACPLKVLEYTAAGKAVVATDLAELRNWGFPNVTLAEPTGDAFARAITRALGQPPATGAQLDRFRWSHLSARLLEILDEVEARGKIRR